MAGDQQPNRWRGRKWHQALKQRLQSEQHLRFPGSVVTVPASFDLYRVLSFCRQPGRPSHPSEVTHLASVREGGVVAQRKGPAEALPRVLLPPLSQNPLPAPPCRPSTPPLLCRNILHLCPRGASCTGGPDSSHQPRACDSTVTRVRTPSSSPSAEAFICSTAHGLCCPTWRVSLRPSSPAFPSRERPQWNQSSFQN